MAELGLTALGLRWIVGYGVELRLRKYERPGLPCATRLSVALWDLGLSVSGFNG